MSGVGLVISAEQPWRDLSGQPRLRVLQAEAHYRSREGLIAILCQGLEPKGLYLPRELDELAQQGQGLTVPDGDSQLEVPAREVKRIVQWLSTNGHLIRHAPLGPRARLSPLAAPVSATPTE